MIRHLSGSGHEVTVASLARSAAEANEGRGIAAYCARYEKRRARMFDLGTATTRAEWETLESYGVGVATDWFPNGVDTEYFSPGDAPYDADTISFVGRMDYYPNQECMFDFCTNVLPLL